jgi:hypothetical protein
MRIRLLTAQLYHRGLVLALKRDRRTSVDTPGEQGSKHASGPAAPFRLARIRNGFVGLTFGFSTGSTPGLKDVLRWVMPDSVFRLEPVRAAVDASLPRLGIETFREALGDHGNYPSCCHPDDRLPLLDRGATVASVLMDLDERRRWVAEGHPCSTPYEELDYGEFIPSRPLDAPRYACDRPPIHPEVRTDASSSQGLMDWSTIQRRIRFAHRENMHPPYSNPSVIRTRIERDLARNIEEATAGRPPSLRITIELDVTEMSFAEEMRKFVVGRMLLAGYELEPGRVFEKPPEDRPRSSSRRIQFLSFRLSSQL